MIESLARIAAWVGLIVTLTLAAWVLIRSELDLALALILVGAAASNLLVLWRPANPVVLLVSAVVVGAVATLLLLGGTGLLYVPTFLVFIGAAIWQLWLRLRPDTPGHAPHQVPHPQLPFIAPPIPRSPLGRGRTILLLVASLAVVGAALFALSGLVDRKGLVQPADQADEHLVETDWFVARVPEGWTPVVPQSYPLGKGVLGMQITNFGAKELLCVGEGGTIPPRGVLLRLTIGPELGWEQSLVLPDMEPKLAVPAGPATFVEDCGAAEKLFGIFFGPDGQLMTAHVLLGAEVAPTDKETVSRIVSSLAPTGHAPVLEPPVQMVVAEGVDKTIGRWLMSFQPAIQGRAEGIFFYNENWAFGTPIDASPRSLAASMAGSNDESGQLLVVGVAPGEAAEVVLEVEGQPDRTGTLVPIPEGLSTGIVAFFVGPYPGRIGGPEGTELTPSASLVVRDQSGNELDRQQLPAN